MMTAIAGLALWRPRARARTEQPSTPPSTLLPLPLPALALALGADAVAAVLTPAGFPVAKIEAVRAAIRTHMYYRQPLGPEAVYLHDADALDWLGAIGIARILGLVDPNGGDPDGPKAIGMVEANLRDVPPTVVSKAGRALVGPRLREAERYLQELRRETDNLHTL